MASFAERTNRASTTGATSVTNVSIVGLGGQGVVKASDILSDAAFSAGYDVKKSELHGMSQRGGSVRSDVRFGSRVLSPMVSSGEAAYLVVLDPTQVEPHRHLLRTGGVLITPEAVDLGDLPHAKALNVALLARLSRYLDFPDSSWHAALCRALKPEAVPTNLALFERLRAQPEGNL